MRPRLCPRPAPLVARLPRRTVRLRLTALYGMLFLASGTGLLAITNILARSWPWPPLGIKARGHGLAAGPGAAHSAYAHQLQAQAAHQHAAALNQLLADSAIALGIVAAASVALGWLVADRVLRPLRQMTAATRAISEDNLHQRLNVPGPGDELKELGDTIDSLLERLQAAFDAQRNFVANASHELRTPLTAERTMIEVALADPAASPATLRSVCEDVLEAGQQQERLIEALLTLARSQRGLGHREYLDLADIIQQALNPREPEAAARGLAVSTSITATPVAGDARLLARLAANLIDNAIRHNTPGGQIGVQVTTSDGHPQLKITNRGPVIPAGQVTALLQPFQRWPASRTARAASLGMGLPIIAAIAKAHHARLTISPGRRGGLDVDITFPRLHQGKTGRRTLVPA